LNPSQPPPPGNWFWPDLSTRGQAERVARRGFYALAIIGVLTLAGSPPQSVLLGPAFLLLALGIRLGHATAAAAGMLVAAGPLAMLFFNRGPHWMTFLFSGFIQCLLVAYFPFLSFRALRRIEQFRDEAGEARSTSLLPGLLAWIPISLLALAYFVFAAPNLYFVPEPVPGRGLLAGDVVLLTPSAEPLPEDESGARAALAARARRIVWSVEATPEEIKSGRIGTVAMYTRLRRERLLQPLNADRTR
jgi:hypothetical protein